MNPAAPKPSLCGRRAALALLLMLVAGGCAAPVAAPMPPAGPMQRVGSVSLIGDRVPWRYFGQPSLDHRAASITAADWRLDTAAANAVARGLAPGMTGAPLPAGPRLRAAVNQTRSLDEFLPRAIKQLGLQ